MESVTPVDPRRVRSNWHYCKSQALFGLSSYRPRVLPNLIIRPSFPVNECWSLIHPRLHLSNDPRGPCPVCRGVQCSISPAPPLALPVNNASIFYSRV
jgi:hypothetical protein